MFAGGGRRRPDTKESTQEHRMGARRDFEAVVALMDYGFLGKVLEKSVFFAEEVGGGIDACREVREDGHKRVAKGVAGNGEIAIGTILHPGNVVGTEPGDLVGMRFIEEWTQERHLRRFGHNAFGGKAGESLRSTATGKAKNHILGAIVRLMGKEEPRIGLGTFTEQATEEGKAFAAGIDLFGLMRALGRLGATDVERNRAFGTEHPHKGFGFIAILIGKGVVKVCGGEGNARFGTAAEKRNGIGSATEAEEPGMKTDGREAHQLRTRVTTRA